MKPFFEDGQITLYHGDCRDILPLLAPESVDLVLTDPPYDRKSIALYGEAAALCAPLMKRGAAFVCYCGHYAVGEIIAAVAPHLRYWWMLAHYQPGDSLMLLGTRVWVRWKPLLVFVKGTALWKPYLSDYYTAPTKVGKVAQKVHHEWAQPVEPVREMIAQLTAPGGLVLDPFAGGGTTLRAAKDLGRRAVGVEMSERHCATTVRRMAQQVLPLDAA